MPWGRDEGVGPDIASGPVGADTSEFVVFGGRAFSGLSFWTGAYVEKSRFPCRLVLSGGSGVSTVGCGSLKDSCSGGKVPVSSVSKIESSARAACICSLSSTRTIGVSAGKTCPQSSRVHSKKVVSSTGPVISRRYLVWQAGQSTIKSNLLGYSRIVSGSREKSTALTASCRKNYNSTR